MLCHLRIDKPVMKGNILKISDHNRKRETYRWMLEPKVVQNIKLDLAANSHVHGVSATLNARILCAFSDEDKF